MSRNKTNRNSLVTKSKCITVTHVRHKLHTQRTMKTNIYRHELHATPVITNNKNKTRYQASPGIVIAIRRTRVFYKKH